ncbi:DUF7504 family protein [Halorarius halobius]|uniref:DUF7504 family protein n=1 Tax=Halorarius halobius TaxID=2962671 RepID=UPI0020CD5CC7|nr:hypothetical protein [Halorarius halobius]
MTDGTTTGKPLRRVAVERPPSFGDYLQRLRTAGSALLVTGRTDEWVQRHASRKLLGHPHPGEDAEPRYRLAVAVDGTTAADEFLPTGSEMSSPAPRTIHGAVASTRGATTEAAGTVGRPGGTPASATLADDVVAAIDEFAAGGELAPGQLRVGTTSLLPILEREGVDAATEFCQQVGDAVRRHDGTAHFHCPLPDGDRQVGLLNEVVNARVELRQRNGDPVQCRWHTPYPGLTADTGWMDFG